MIVIIDRDNRIHTFETGVSVNGSNVYNQFKEVVGTVPSIAQWRRREPTYTIKGAVQFILDNKEKIMRLPSYECYGFSKIKKLLAKFDSRKWCWK